MQVFRKCFYQALINTDTTYFFLTIIPYKTSDNFKSCFKLSICSLKLFLHSLIPKTIETDVPKIGRLIQHSTLVQSADSLQENLSCLSVGTTFIVAEPQSIKINTENM